jgi:hypothetical protein
MTQNDNGSFEVRPGETITITVTIAGNAANLASFSDPEGCNCGPVNGGASGPISRTCVMPSNVCSWCKVTVVLAWAKNPQGGYNPDEIYTVTITDQAGSSVEDMVGPPPPKSGIYRFHVSQS